MAASDNKQRRYSYITMLLMLATVLYLPLWIHAQWKSFSYWTGAGSNAHPHLKFFSAGMAPGSRGIRRGSMTNDDNEGLVRSLQDRVGYLETKLNAYLGFASDPFLSNKLPAKCANTTTIKAIACVNKPDCEVDNQNICLDAFTASGGNDPAEPCLVYDFGIRKSPEYGLAFAGPPFNCDVVGFDPSPISLKWWEDDGATILQKYPGYRFVPEGAGGHDGATTLFQYDWGQVSIITFPERVVNTSNCDEGGACKFSFHTQQKQFNIPVKTLSTFVKELGHSGRRITVLKLDVEGSEYAMLEELIEHDVRLCQRIDQLTLEWHHYDYDRRYGFSSNPQINMIVKLLESRCGLEQFWIHTPQGWPSNQKIYTEMGMALYYNLASFKRTRWFDNEGMEVTAGLSK